MLAVLLPFDHEEVSNGIRHPAAADLGMGRCEWALGGPTDLNHQPLLSLARTAKSDAQQPDSELVRLAPQFD